MASYTVAQIFSMLGLPQWWDAGNITQAYGQNGEKGDDYGLGGMGKPVGSISGGRVVYVGNGGYPGSSIGQIVQVLTPDGGVLHYQHLKTSNVTVGQSVQVGTVLGTGGGCPAGAYYADPSNNGCLWYDQYSTGQHIEVRASPTYNPSGGVWGQAWMDPKQLFLTMAGKPAPTSAAAGNGVQLGTGSIDIAGYGTRIGLFLLALIAISFGLYMLFSKQINSSLQTAAETAGKAILA